MAEVETSPFRDHFLTQEGQMRSKAGLFHRPAREFSFTFNQRSRTHYLGVKVLLQVGQRSRPVESIAPSNTAPQIMHNVVTRLAEGGMTRVGGREAGGNSALTVRNTWVANSASVRVDSVGFPSRRGFLHRGHLTWLPWDRVSTVKESLQVTQLISRFCCFPSRSFTWATVR